VVVQGRLCPFSLGRGCDVNCYIYQQWSDRLKQRQSHVSTTRPGLVYVLTVHRVVIVIQCKEDFHHHYIGILAIL